MKKQASKLKLDSYLSGVVLSYRYDQLPVFVQAYVVSLLRAGGAPNAPLRYADLSETAMWRILNECLAIMAEQDVPASVPRGTNDQWVWNLGSYFWRKRQEATLRTPGGFGFAKLAICVEKATGQIHLRSARAPSKKTPPLRPTVKSKVKFAFHTA